MAEVCIQEARMKHFEDSLTEALRDIRDDQRRQTKLLENIARQSVRLDNLESGHLRHEKAIEDLFKQAREFDKIPGAVAIRVLLMLASLGSASASGLIVWYMTTKG